MKNIVARMLNADHLENIAMPNEIFDNISEMWKKGSLKSKNHQEFIYSYYYLLAYLWRYALYYPKGISQGSIKEILGYNSTEKRVNYIMKENGLLDKEGLTISTLDFPVSWELCSEGISFTRFMDYDEFARESLKVNLPKNYIVKEPVIHVGDSENEGIFHSSSNCHMIDAKVFGLCLYRKELGLSSFYMYGILKYMRDKNHHFNDTEFFNCANETLVEITSWSLKKVIKVTNELQSANLITKEQRIKIKGNVNFFGVL